MRKQPLITLLCFSKRLRGVFEEAKWWQKAHSACRVGVSPKKCFDCTLLPRHCDITGTRNEQRGDIKHLQEARRSAPHADCQIGVFDYFSGLFLFRSSLRALLDDDEAL